MLDPLELLRTARALTSGSAAPDDAALRRAVLTAYYALFHAVLKMAAERFVGATSNDTVGYALIYRGFAHGKMKSVCRAIDKTELTPQYQNLLRRPHVSHEMRGFASVFIELQERRQSADYDPQSVIQPSDAIDACSKAELAIQALGRTDTTGLTDVLALLLVDARA